MLNGVAATLRWCLSLGAKFIKEVPLRTQWIVLLTLVSQVSMLVASFLPLKVVIMLGSDRIPRYFPEAIRDYDRGQVLALLSTLAITFFVLHNVSERLITTLTRSGSRRLLARSRKMVLFDNQDEIATQAYERFSRALASGVFVGLAALLMLWLYPRMAFIILGYGLGVVILLAAAYHLSPAFSGQFDRRLSGIAKFFSTLGFFTAFGTLLVDFTLGSMPNAIIAILSLLLTRQLMSRWAASVTDINRLWRQRNRLDALFFHRIVLMPTQSDAGLDFWRLLQPNERHTWISDVMAEFLPQDVSVTASSWFPLAITGVAGLRVHTSDGTAYLLKLYNQNRTVWALHEADLMAEGVQCLPALPWVATTKVMDYHCLIYQLPEGKRPEGKAHRNAVKAVHQHLLALQPPRAIQTRYVRSRPTLDKRLDRQTFERLGIAADTAEQRETLSAWDTKLPDLLERLRDLPLVLHTPDIGSEQLWETEQQVYCLHWGRWTLEPAGAGLVGRPNQLADLQTMAEHAQEHQPVLAQASMADIRLAALLHMLEASCHAERLATGLHLVNQILQESD